MDYLLKEEADEDDNELLETTTLGSCDILKVLIMSSSCDSEAFGVFFLHVLSTA